MDFYSQYSAIIPRYPELDGKVAVVTGSSRGIGRGIAMRFAREGMKVVINARTAETVEATAADLRAVGAEALAVPADLGRSDGVEKLFDESLRAFGSVHVLVNNAANLHRRWLPDVDEALLDDELSTNIRGPFLCAQRAAEVMREAGSGSIIHISSVGGRQGHWRGLPYDVTKGAIDAMTRTMAIELASLGIRVNAIAPGATYTRGPVVPEDVDQRAADRIPAGRIGLPLDIGAAAAFLASDDAAYIIGQVIYVDGGMTAQLGPACCPL
jgi:NAD(P)-dependent dehydrogenase (short-subunit alcohol dehydrogenase family)